MSEFRDLDIGDRFDFVSPNLQGNSFYDVCEKISWRKYRSLNTGAEYRVGSLRAKVYHVVFLRRPQGRL